MSIHAATTVIGYNNNYQESKLEDGWIGLQNCRL